ncbi:serine hydrolase [Emticicia sp. BO119]|uniref:serine hydrolase domain-containing protein n=1 Tax=Emticicia sp. BO119 TaxID=2757768 RepID=UPI0015F0F3C1|nr:serine hydrolase domain-containing protein [Emticicia sp. BO119]MBA4849524.1 beta-lactamase family protein [Emticicia sp. BO119]
MSANCQKYDNSKSINKDASSVGLSLNIDSGRVDKYILARMAQSKIPAISIGIVYKGDLIYANAYGKANLEHNIALKPESPFKLASLTKPFTAFAILQLFEKGKIKLDEKASFYLKNLPIKWETITVRQLLSHTSGLADYFQSPDWSWQNSWRLDLSHKEFIAMNEKSPIIFSPGERMQYCNTNYYLLGMIIEVITGKSYNQYLKEEIFEPLGMSHTQIDKSEMLISDRVNGYTLSDKKLLNAEYTSNTWAYSEGGLISTVEDLAKFDKALYSEALLRKETIKEMWSPSKLKNGKEGVIGDNGAGNPNHYGLGWFLSDYKGHKLTLAGGNKPGFTCTYFHFEDKSLSIIILSNLSSSPLYPMAGEIAEMYLNW